MFLRYGDDNKSYEKTLLFISCWCKTLKYGVKPLLIIFDEVDGYARKYGN